MGLLNTKQAAQLLNVHPKHVYRLLKQGLPAARIGSEWRFEREAIVRWAKQARSRSAPQDPPDAGRSALNVLAPPPLLAANGDIVVDELLALLNSAAAGDSGGSLMGFVLADQTNAMRYLFDNRVLFAGVHENLSHSPKAGAPKAVRVHLATREIGLASRKDQPLHKLSALVRKRLGLRPATAGVRQLLDQTLTRAGIELDSAYQRASIYASHREVVLAVAAGQVDVGITTHAWAERCGLAFHAISSESYSLCVRADALSDARVVRLCEIVQSQEFRARIRDQHGYGVEHTGEVKFG
ncbi:MAG: helix-turn-helix transcriptional regulator [Polyangiaceae bacterium]